MYGSKHKNNVKLFPLCDARGVLIQTLQNSAESPTTRSDALVFAWRLELPRGMNVAKAANAILTVAMATPREQWSRDQLVIVRELMVLAGREGSLPGEKPTVERSPMSRRRVRSSEEVSLPASAIVQARRRERTAATGPASSREASAASAPDATSAKPKIPKEQTTWWKMVGRDSDDQPENRSQRKTRTGRAFREPQ